MSIVDEDDNPLTLDQAKALPFMPYDGSPAVADEEDEDEVAEAVLELKDVTAKHGMELQTIAAKLGRAEGEVQALKNEMAELRATVAAGAAAAPAAVAEQAVAAPVQEAVTPPPKKSRLQRAAEKRAAVSEPAEPAVGEPSEVSEPPETAGTSRRVQRKMTK